MFIDKPYKSISTILFAVRMMIRKLLIFFLLNCFMHCHSQIVEIPDSSFLAAHIEAGIDTDGLTDNIELNTSYIPMNFEQGIWYLYEHPKEGNQEWIQVYCDGVTVYEGEEYYNLFRNRWIMGLYSTDTILGEYYGLIRNTESRQVIYIYGDEDVVVYDFNLALGDTIHGWYGDLFVVNSIDSVEYCGRYHRRYVDHTELTLTEGIGFSNGLLGYFHPFQQEGTRELFCYAERNIPECSACEYPLGIYTQSLKLEIYPMPADNYVVIKSPKPMMQLRILDLTGKEVLHNNVNNKLIHKESIEYMSPGIYSIFIELYDHSCISSLIVKN